MRLYKTKASAGYAGKVLVGGSEFAFKISVSSETDFEGARELVNQVVDLFRKKADSVQVLAKGAGEPGVNETVDPGTGEIH